MPVYLIAILLIQIILTQTIFNNFVLTVISTLFSLFILCINLFDRIRMNEKLKRERTQHFSDLDLLEDEIIRLQKFNTEHITTIKKLKSYSKSVAKRLKEGHIDFLNTASSMDTPIILTDYQGKVNWVNSSAEKLYGFSESVLKDENIEDLMIFPENMGMDQILVNLNNGEEQEMELQMRKSTGEYVLTFNNFSFLKDRNQKIKGISIIQLNITDLRSNEETLKESLEKSLYNEKELKKLIDSHIETNQKLESTQKDLRIALEKEKEAKAVLNQTISALKETHSKLTEKEKMASMGKMVAKVTHEISNPLNFVINGVEILLGSVKELLNIISRYEQLSKEDLKSLSFEVNQLRKDVKIHTAENNLEEIMLVIDEGTTRISDIVNGLNVLSKAVVETKSEIEVNKILNIALDKINKKYKSVFFDIDINDNLRINASESLIQYVLYNLLENAVQSYDQGSIKKSVSIEIRNKAETLSIKIEDQGRGIPDTIQDKIFEPFFTTKPVGMGTGLGLFISKGIIKEYGGKLDFNSSKSRGTTFEIRLPLVLERALKKAG